jgi:hypothetical protein
MDNEFRVSSQAFRIHHIEKSNIEGEIATYFDCEHTKCTSCKGPAHIRDCTNDTSLQLLLETVLRNGW